MSNRNIDNNKLESLGIYELRNLARTLGVPRPTTILRGELLGKIKEILSSNEHVQITEQALFTPARRGRPPRTTEYSMSRIFESEPAYDNVFEMPDETIFSNTFMVSSSVKTTEEVRNVTGFFHLLPRGHGVIISSCLNTYHVPVKLIHAHVIETGDKVEARATWNNNENRYIVEEVTKHERTNFDSAEGARPHTIAKLDEHSFKLGSRIIIHTPRVYDRVEHIVKLAKSLEKTIYKIAVIVSENDEVISYLQDNGIDEVYLLKVNLSTKKQIMLSLASLFNCKQHATSGKDVVLFIDSLSKLYKIYNMSSTENGMITADQINLGPLTDLKTFFMSSKQLKESGSLSIVGYANRPNNQTEGYVYDEFVDLANAYIELI